MWVCVGVCLYVCVAAATTMDTVSQWPVLTLTLLLVLVSGLLLALSEIKSIAVFFLLHDDCHYLICASQGVYSHW